MIRGILFDKDDTLVRLEDFWREPIRVSAAFAVREALGREDGGSGPSSGTGSGL